MRRTILCAILGTTLSLPGFAQTEESSEQILESSYKHGFDLGLRQNLTGKVKKLELSETDYNFANESVTGLTSIVAKYRHGSKLIFSHGLEYGLAKDMGAGDSVTWDGEANNIASQKYSELQLRLIDVGYRVDVMEKLAVMSGGGLGIGYAEQTAAMESAEFDGQFTIKSHQVFADLRVGSRIAFEATPNLLPYIGVDISKPMSISHKVETDGDWYIYGIEDETYTENMNKDTGVALALQLGLAGQF